MPTPRRAPVRPSAPTPAPLPAPIPALAIQLLGGFAVAVDGRAIPPAAWPARKAQQLVKLLALAPGQRLTSDQVFDALWPEIDPATLTGTFRQARYLARRTLGHAAFLALRDDILTLAPPGGCVVDVVVFERAAAAARQRRTRADYAAALALYAGALLPDEQYTDWALGPAEQLRALALSLRRELATLHEQAGDEGAAEELWRRVLADEPADEAAHAGLMRGYARQGQRQRALQQYQLLHARLRDDLALEPDPAIQRLYAAILGGRYPAPAPAPPVPAPPAARPPHALPRALTTLIGRDDEGATVAALLDGAARLVTLTGAGGCGKTRLALAVAEAVLPRFPGGVWWIGLAGLTDGALVAETLAQVLGVQQRSGATMLATLSDALRERPALLVFDNAEHLRAACAEVLLALLAGCPALRVLVTSRAALRIVGEQTWRVPLPPPVPVAAAPAQLATLAANEAVRLFVARAQLARAGFALTAGNAAAIAAICWRMEGLPLAIELAAARVALLDPAQLAARLDDALGLLTDGPRGLPDRQRTLRAALDWSWGLLHPTEQRLLARLAVFAGGWTLDAAEALGDAGGTAILTALAGLVEHSLVQVEPGADDEAGVRYRLLEPVRQYAAERLRASGTAERQRHDHAAYFLRLAERAEPEFYRAQQGYWVALLGRDHDNVRAALHWLRDAAAPVEFTRLIVAFHRFWYMRAAYAEGRGWVAAALQLGDAAPADAALAALRPYVVYCAGTLAWPTGAMTEAEDAFRRALDLATEHRLPGLVARARMGLGILCLVRGDYEAGRPHFEVSLAEARQLDDRWLLGALLNNLGLIAMWGGQPAQARRYQDENLALCRRTDDAHGIASALANLCEIAFTEGDLAAVAAYADEAAVRFAAVGDRRGLAVVHNNRAVVARVAGDYPLAQEHGEAALAAYRTIGNAAGMALARRILAETATARGERATARALYRQSLEHYRQSRHPRDVAQCLESVADLAWRDGDRASAARFAAAAGALRTAHTLQPLPTDLLLREQLHAATHAALGAAAFDAATAVGNAWTLDEALDEALAYLGTR